MNIQYASIYQTILSMFPDKKHQDWIFKKVDGMDMSDGCWTRCSALCNSPNPTGYMESFDDFILMVQEHPKKMSNTSLYCLSNPPDYEGKGGQSIVDCCSLVEKITSGQGIGASPPIWIGLPREQKFGIVYEMLKKQYVGYLSIPFFYEEDRKVLYHPKRVISFLSFLRAQEGLRTSIFSTMLNRDGLCDIDDLINRFPQLHFVEHLPNVPSAFKNVILVPHPGQVVYFQEPHSLMNNHRKNPITPENIEKYMWNYP